MAKQRAMRRHYSAEDVDTQLAATESETVEVFVAYARCFKDPSVKMTRTECEEGEPQTATEQQVLCKRRPADLGVLAEDNREAPSSPSVSPTAEVDAALMAVGLRARQRSFSTPEIAEVNADGGTEGVLCGPLPRAQDQAVQVARRLIAIADTVQYPVELEIVNDVENLLHDLTWQKVGALFFTAYRLMEDISAADQSVSAKTKWLFDRLWRYLIGHVSRWITQSGGWSALLSGSRREQAYVEVRSPNASRRSVRRIHSLSESGTFVEEDEVSSLSEESGDTSGSSVGRGEHDAQTPFSRDRSRSLPPRLREKKSLRSSLDGVIYGGAMFVYRAFCDLRSSR